MFTRRDLDALMAQNSQPAISITMPSHPAGKEIRQDPIRLGNLLSAAEDRLTERGMRRDDARTLLEPASRLVRENHFWRHQNHGLALYLAPGFFECFRVAVELPEMLVVGRHFHVTPLLPLISDDSFLVIAASADGVKLYDAGPAGLCDISGEGLPQGVAEIYGETDYDQTVHANPVARPRSGRPTSVPKAHNFGEDPEELRKTALVEYLHRAASTLNERLSGNAKPIVLMAQAEVGGHLEKMLKVGPSIDRVEANFQSLGEDETFDRARQAVAPLFQAIRDKEVEHVHAMVSGGDSRATTQAPDIVKAARFGRVDTLLIADGEHLWGRFDEASDHVETHREPAAEDDDLLDFAAIHTLQQGGQVKIVPRDALPRHELAAAILRF